MSPKWVGRLLPFVIVIGIIAALVVLGITQLSSKTGTEEDAAAVQNILAQKKIIDVHEHIQSLEQAPVLLAAMDQVGIAKTVLMGSSLFTLTLNPSVGFTKYDENNEQLMEICKQYPGRFEAWPTVNPLDPEKLEKFQKLVERGATGLKLYIGHSFVNPKTGQYMFHTAAIDDPGMRPLYQYCQDNNIPVCLHVQPSFKGPGFAEEFIAVLLEFPDMKVVCPHYMLSSVKDSRLREFLDTFPNLYTDISFGFDTYFEQGLKRISKNPQKFRDLFKEYPTRFMFSCDLVLTTAYAKDAQWTIDRVGAYVDMLTKGTYSTPAVQSGLGLNGLALAPDLLERILYKNYEDFMAAKPKGTKITRSIDWSQMGTKPTGRKPGQMLPPPASDKNKEDD